MTGGCTLGAKSMSKMSKKEEIEQTKSEKPLIKIVKYITILLVCFLIWNILFMNTIVPTGSMEDTIMSGDRVLCMRLYGTIARGDVVVFDNPRGDGYLVKRVVAIGGDTINFTDGYFILNGEVQQEEYTKGLSLGINITEEREVPEGEYFLLGDNRENSLDCRTFDYPFIKKSSIRAKMGLRYYPLNRFGIVD